MRIQSFEVKKKRSIGLAKCDAAPRLMIVAGPNGSGKSTLLNELRNINGYKNILYVGPHRSIRRQLVQQRHLISTSFSIEELLARSDAPGFEGIRLIEGTRDPWGADDSANYLKHALCQIEVERQQAIAARMDRDGEIKRGTLPDTWKPLRELTHSLLPHLTFDKIDNSDRDQIRCLWKVHSKEFIVDLDDLSSGEKSIIQMFYPLVENQIKSLLREIQTGAKPQVRPDICVLIDEPELHLHPNLQVKVLDYLRVLISDHIQVILATHSPTIVENAGFDELFLLRPIELISSGENQLVQIATDEDRLKLLRSVFGTTSNLTAMQPLVIVEGVAESRSGHTLVDRKLFRALHKGFDSVTLLPGGGKAECLKLLTTLNEILPIFAKNLLAFALLDRDLSNSISVSNVHLLPVSMIENFLLDPLVIWETIQSVIEKTDFKTMDDLESALNQLLDEMENAEIERLTKSSLGYANFRPDSPVKEAPAQAARFSREILEKFSTLNVDTLETEARKQIAQRREGKQRREYFHGKDAVDLFYKKHLHNTGLAKGIFKFEAARHALERKSVKQFFDEFFEVLKKPGVVSETQNVMQINT